MSAATPPSAARLIAFASGGVLCCVVAANLPRLLEATALLLRQLGFDEVRDEERHSVAPLGERADLLEELGDLRQRSQGEFGELLEKLDHLHGLVAGQHLVGASSPQRLTKRDECGHDCGDALAGVAGSVKVHGTSPSSVGPVPPLPPAVSPAEDTAVAPEGTGAAGFESPDPVVPVFVCSCGFVTSPDAGLRWVRAEGMIHRAVECSKIPHGPQPADADDVIAGRARYRDTAGGHADRKTLAAERSQA